jgi:hypothetical protein
VETPLFTPHINRSSHYHQPHHLHQTDIGSVPQYLLIAWDMSDKWLIRSFIKTRKNCKKRIGSNNSRQWVSIPSIPSCHHIISYHTTYHDRSAMDDMNLVVIGWNYQRYYYYLSSPSFLHEAYRIRVIMIESLMSMDYRYNLLHSILHDACCVHHRHPHIQTPICKTRWVEGG